MSPLQDWERSGLKDFFSFDVRTEAIAIDMARSLASTVCITSPKNSPDAIVKILRLCDSVQIILEKKAVTKDILTTYLMERGATFTPNATKQTLIQRTLQLWQEKFRSQALPPPVSQEPQPVAVPENSPVNLLSQQFASWFYRNLNDASLTLQDLWPDVSCAIRLVQNNSVVDESADGSEAVLQKLLSTRQNYNFTFNPNVNPSGVQGRTDPHGLVFVVCCGTLHVLNRWVGVFESAFGLVQDPHTGPNNWKCKHLKIELRSTQQESLPTLQECESIKDIFALPIGNQRLPD